MPYVCDLLQPSLSPRPLDFQKYRDLHPEGKRLITSWFAKAWNQREDENAKFESFIFAWFAVNAWAACITGKDRDVEYINHLSRDVGLQSRFQHLLVSSPDFQSAARCFHRMWPIFKAQRIRRHEVRAGEGLTRDEVVAHYLGFGINEYAPDCWSKHKAADEETPLDWQHTLAAIYRVRCNLFHGEKSAHSEMDRLVVRAAFDVLVLFFRRAEIL